MQQAVGRRHGGGCANPDPFVTSLFPFQPENCVTERPPGQSVMSGAALSPVATETMSRALGVVRQGERSLEVTLHG
jgi:hypothetical protein